MPEILFNSEGITLIAYDSRFISTTTGVSVEKLKTTSPVHPLDEKTTVGDLSVSTWGDGNDFPNFALELINKTGVLNTGLKFLRNLVLRYI
ncbi:MAG: hypothetical protein WC865_10695 [Bacteroidales bacterium]